MRKENNEFFELDSEIIEFRGDIFERLVEIVLKKLYPQYSFTRTEYSHDGGKDFYAADGETNIWAEAKCHKRHLELGRIASTFIMAELCKINRIIIFSLSDLTSGSVNNLTKFTSRNRKELIIFSGSDIRTLIRSFGEIKSDEIIRLVGSTFDLNDKATTFVKNESFDEIERLLVTLKSELKEAKNEDKDRYRNEINLFLTLYAFLIFNYIARGDTPTNKISREVNILDKQFYLQNDSANLEKLKTELRAFDIFTAELIIRNEDVLRSKKVKIEFKELTTNYRAITPSAFDNVLLPGQSIALTFYFKALNTSCNLTLPQPQIIVDDKFLECAMTHNDISVIPCRVIGEVPYLGKDSNRLSQLNQDLEDHRYFSTVLVYGKSGVGKSRFLYELQTACLKRGKRCFIFHGDNINNSIIDFIRQLLYGYYNISFVGENSEIILPESLVNSSNKSQIQKNIEFINSCLNCKDENEINLTVARNWLDDILKTNNTTLIIDNVQNLNKEVLNLLNNVIYDLRNCKCNSEIILTFNTELFISDSPTDNFFKHLKCVVKDKFNILLQGFDDNSAIEYLEYSLDPQGERKDLEELYKEVAKRAQNNPLFLKQIVLYLNQQEIIGFQNDTICILNHSKLIDELSSLPSTVFDMIRARFQLLIANAGCLKKQIEDLFWSILIFGEFSESYIYYIDKFNMDVLNLCIMLGFIKHGSYDTLLFEHQLIAKSTLLLLENKAYNAHPFITQLGLSDLTAKNFLENIQLQKHKIILFAIKEKYGKILLDDFNNLLPTLSLNNVNELFITYVVNLVCKHIRRYNSDLYPELKIEALSRLIKCSQDRFGVQRTAYMFEEIIEFQAENYKLNTSCAGKFIELLKYYMYELPTLKKDEFLSKIKKIGQDLLSGSTDKAEKDDFEIWTLWASGKNAMQTYRFEEASTIFKSAVALAKSNNNKHRVAELEIQLGYLYSYMEDKEQTEAHWSNACLNFSGLNFYETVLNYVYEGNVGLLKGDFIKSNVICAELKKIYDSKDSYDFLKSVINDFISNSLILELVCKGEYSAEKINEIIIVLERFRTLTLMYDINAYLHAAYKSLVFYNYILENFSLFINDEKCKKYKKFIYVVSEELIRNYDWNLKSFEFFYPVLKDIAFAVGKDKTWCDYFAKMIPEGRRRLFLSLCTRTNCLIEYAPKLRKGIFNDNDDKVNLFHYTYQW